MNLKSAVCMEAEGINCYSTVNSDDLVKINEEALNLAKERECSICWNPFFDDNYRLCVNHDGNYLAVATTWCQHQFHADCLNAWLKKQDSCPFCRRSIMLSSEMQDAVCNDDSYHIKKMLKNGHLINGIDSAGLTALHFAIGSTANVVKLLLENGATVDAKNHSGETPLHLTAFFFDLENIAKILLDHGAAINAITYEGNTPLHYAIKYENEPMVALLLENGASLHTKNHDGKTAIRLAKKAKNHTIRALLKNERLQRKLQKHLAAD